MRAGFHDVIACITPMGNSAASIGGRSYSELRLETP
jgi:hypothetical protein